MKKTACIFLALSLICLTGCWNNSEITDLAIVVGVGIDRNPDGTFEYTVQVINPSKSGGSMQASQSSPSQGNGATLQVSSTGSTIYEAVRNLIPSLSKRPYYAHIQLMVIGEKAAKDGLDNIWDFFERDHEVNRLFEVIVAKGGTAKSVLEAQAGFEQIGAAQISDSVNNKVFGKNVKLKAHDLTIMLGKPHAGIVTGVIENTGSGSLSDMKVQGGAVFKHAKLIGYLNNNQTRGYLFAKNEMQSTALVVPNPTETGRLVSIEVNKSTGRLTAEAQSGKLKLGIQIEAHGNIGDEQGQSDLANMTGAKELESEAEALIKADIADMMRVSQKELNCDILGFGDFLYKHHYDDYKRMQANWDELYRNAEVSISVIFKIKRPGIIKRPAYSG